MVLSLATVAVMVVSLTFAGTLDVIKTLSWQHAKAAMFDSRGQELAAAVRQGTPQDAVFLTAQQPNNPISGLGGRRIVLGYTGWLWSYGIDYHQREKDVATMLSGNLNTAELLKQYGIDYVVIGPSERNDKGYQVNEPYY